MTDEAARARLTPAMPTDRLLGWVVSLGVFVVALVLRLHRLTIPKGIMFDEVYYAKDSHDLLLHGYELNGTGTGPGYVVHPPLGKWMIALGEKLFGQPVGHGVDVTAGLRHPELGWRISAAVFGSLAILIFTRTARRMFRSTLLGGFAGLLMTLDGLEFVQSRIAMLDIFLFFWVVAALACLVLDREDGRRRLAQRWAAGTHAAESWAGPRLGFRWWRLACGVCLGAACGVKWSGLYFVAVFPLIALAWDVGARRTAGVVAPVRAVLWRDLGLGFVSFVVLAGLAYTATWTGWFLSNDAWDRHHDGRHGFWGSLMNWGHYQKAAFQFHETLAKPHVYQSRPLSWLVLGRPVSYFYQGPKYGERLGSHLTCTVPRGCAREVLAIGTPAIWWVSALAILAVLGVWWSRRDWRAALIAAGFGAAVLPWMAYPSRTMFIFYALPALPFIILAITMVAGLVLGRPDQSDNRRLIGALIVGAYVLLVLVNFSGLYPVLAAKMLSIQGWQSRVSDWFPGWI